MREEEGEGWTFYSLRDWMLWLLFSALDHEGDSANMQMLLHGLFMSIQDIGRQGGGGEGRREGSEV